jgi:hypothetical protein
MPSAEVATAFTWTADQRKADEAPGLPASSSSTSPKPWAEDACPHGVSCAQTTQKHQQQQQRSASTQPAFSQQRPSGEWARHFQNHAAAAEFHDLGGSVFAKDHLRLEDDDDLDGGGCDPEEEEDDDNEEREQTKIKRKMKIKHQLLSAVAEDYFVDPQCIRDFTEQVRTRARARTLLQESW